MTNSEPNTVNNFSPISPMIATVRTAAIKVARPIKPTTKYDNLS